MTDKQTAQEKERMRRTVVRATGCKGIRLAETTLRGEVATVKPLRTTFVGLRGVKCLEAGTGLGGELTAQPGLATARVPVLNLKTGSFSAVGQTQALEADEPMEDLDESRSASEDGGDSVDKAGEPNLDKASVEHVEIESSSLRCLF